jgi:hypothetical protein
VVGTDTNPKKNTIKKFEADMKTRVGQMVTNVRNGLKDIEDLQNN